MDSQLKKAALEFCEAVKELHPNLNMGNPKEEKVYLTYHTFMFLLLDEKVETDLTLNPTIK